MSISPKLSEASGVRVAIEGCGHGALDAIYGAVDASCAERGWSGVDLVIIGGDFQATRNAADLNLMSVPPKYRAMGDFHLYYSGARKAPYLTVFIGGNHEAAGYLWELFYGGWVAPNIYYWGAANVLRFGPLRIAGMSGIWKGIDYRQPHHERIPFRQDDIKSFYHVREVDVRKLLQIREPVDIGMSHDWPRAIEWHGDSEHLYRMKPHFRRESMEGTLGNTAAEYVLDRLRPRFWFSAHMHCKFAAIKQFPPPEPAAAEEQPVETVQKENFTDAPSTKIELPAPVNPAATSGNPDEIDLDLDDDEEGGGEKQPTPTAPEAPKEEQKEKELSTISNVDGVSNDMLAQLPASFQRPQQHQDLHHRGPRQKPGQPVPPTITNTQVNFLALDKCLPGRHFLQLCEIGPAESAAAASSKGSVAKGKETGDKIDKTAGSGPRFKLEYDPEWLAITRVFANDLIIGDRNTPVAPDLGEAHYRPLVDAERAWVEENIVAKGRLAVPHDFELTAPIHNPVPGQPETYAKGQPNEYTNPHTAAFCELLQVPNVWHATKQERGERKQRGPGPSTPRHSRDGDGDGDGDGYQGYGGRGGGGYRGRGRGRGGGRGGPGWGNGGGYRGGRGRGGNNFH
ncbi:lariat debranching enzyme [Sporothrix eucalyptigena]|uniref:Lariat debranching enzyme n=1 Tax=Sporothrix eucalyptigena TaxID=1812306 RepID=A0ABP0CWW0_9PEZI